MYENTPSLQTERLMLRRFTDGDMDAFYRIFSDVEACERPKNGATAMAAPFIDAMKKSGYLSGFFLLFSMANASGVSSSPFRFSRRSALLCSTHFLSLNHFPPKSNTYRGWPSG